MYMVMYLVEKNIIMVSPWRFSQKDIARMRKKHLIHGTYIVLGEL